MPEAIQTKEDIEHLVSLYKSDPLINQLQNQLCHLYSISTLFYDPYTQTIVQSRMAEIEELTKQIAQYQESKYPSLFYHRLAT